MTLARWWHTVTAVVVVLALALQLGLVIDGASVLVTDNPPGLWLRLGRLVSYFTIQSNVLVAVASVWLARRPDADGAWFRAVRLAGTVGITVTGLVHFFLLRPLLDLHGLSHVADTLLHTIVPVLAVAGWGCFGPRPRVDARAIGIGFAWPLVWLAWTLLIGATTGWFPYPFLDFHVHAWTAVVVVCLGITALFAALFGLTAWLDRRLSVRPPAPQQQYGGAAPPPS